MTTRAETLATRFEQANNDVIRTVEGLTDVQWHTQTGEEGWTVGVVAHHIADAHEKVVGLAEMVAHSKPVPPLTIEVIHQGNAAHAQAHAHTSKALLRKNGAAAARTVRGLADDQLRRTAPVIGNSMSAEQVIEGILIGHPQGHLASIRKAIGPN
jgi:hypothetical protein